MITEADITEYPELIGFMNAHDEEMRQAFLTRLADSKHNPSYRVQNKTISLLELAVGMGRAEQVNSILTLLTNNYPNDKKVSLKILFSAIDNNDLPVLDRLLQVEGIDIAGQNNYVLQYAAKKGYLPIINRILQFKTVQEGISPGYDSALSFAAEKGHFAIVTRLLEFERVQQNSRSMLIALNKAAKNGYLEIINRLLQFEEVENQIGTVGKLALQEAAENGHHEVVNRLLEFACIQNDIAADNNYALRYAAKNGHLRVVNRLLETLAVQNDIMANAYISRGRLTQLTRNVLREEQSSALWYAVLNGHVEVVSRLLEFEAVRDNLTFNDNAIVRYAMRSSGINMVHRLLENDQVFSYAEKHDHEYGHYIHPFISEKLTRLKNQKIQFERDHAQAVFDIDPLQGSFYFYIIRNLIRRNSPELMEDIRFLLDTPAVKILAHTAVTENEPNELVRLALRTGNQEAAAILLTITAVETLTEENNFYREEAQGQFDLALLAQDRESSMHGLTTGEQKRLQAAIKRYQPIIEQAGADVLFQALYDSLIARYEQNPATINEGVLKLPVFWEEFNRCWLLEDDHTQITFDELDGKNAIILHRDKLFYADQRTQTISNVSDEKRDEYNQLKSMCSRSSDKLGGNDAHTLIKILTGYSHLSLNPAQRESALQAYYQNKNHTALRYLTKPNFWMSENADYVNRNQNGHGSAMFEAYKPNIILCWLAAKDEGTEPINDYTVESRVDHFFDELAFLGRAHNWDPADAENQMGPEFDNLQGDQPSCYSGVKRRLFQSVMGHPLMSILTMQDIKQELRYFVKEQFKHQITNENCKQVQAALNKFTEEAEFDPILKELDVSGVQQQVFIDSMITKYSTQFTDDPGFLKYIQNRFTLRKMDAHVLNFNGEIPLLGLLQHQITLTEANTHNAFFSSVLGTSGEEFRKRSNTLIEPEEEEQQKKKKKPDAP